MTLYFQVQFLKLRCTANAKGTIKNSLNSERKKEVSLPKKTYHQGAEKKMQGNKEKYCRDPESRTQYRKRKYQENPEQQKEYEKKYISGKF